MTAMVTPVDERKARRFWVAMILLLLVSQLSIGFMSIYLATKDHAFVVIPDYYEKGLRYDELQALRQQSDALGWTSSNTISDEVDAAGFSTLTYVISDRTGKPVTGLHGEATLYHLSHASPPVTTKIEELSSGVYRATAALNRTGVWQMDAKFMGQQGETYLTGKELEVKAAAASLK